MKILKVDIAKTPQEQERGLMYRRHLPRNHGMLFAFPQPHILSFWGKNTYIPLDIAFIDIHKRIVNIELIKPHNLSSKKSKTKCIMAIETNAGYFLENRIKIGDKVSIQDNEIKFHKNYDLITQSPKNQKHAQRMVDWEEIEYGDDDQAPIFLDEILEDDLSEQEDPYSNDPIIKKPDSHDQDQADEPNEPFEPPTPDKEYPEFVSTMDAIQWSIFSNEEMFIAYTTKFGRDLTRIIQPELVYHATTTGNIIVVTFDKTVGWFRSFIIPNITYYSFTGNTFQDKNIAEMLEFDDEQYYQIEEDEGFIKKIK